MEHLGIEDATNTHSLDGQWSSALQRFLHHPLAGQAQNVSRAVMRGPATFPLSPPPDLSSILSSHPPEIERLKRAVQRYSPIAAKYFDLILSGQGNWDSSNHVDALFLLSLAACIPENEDFYSALAEQLLDMSTGSCPQGRTTRIAQILDSFL